MSKATRLYTFKHKDDIDKIFKHPSFFIDQNKFEDSKVVKYRVKRIISGPVVEFSVYPLYKNDLPKRVKLGRESRPEQQALNKKNMYKRATRLVNTNFTVHDKSVVLTYVKPPKTIQEAQDNVKNFLRRLNYHHEKKGLPPVKFFFVTSIGFPPPAEPMHHHMIANLVDIELAKKLWEQHGFLLVKKLHKSKKTKCFQPIVHYFLDQAKAAKRGGRKYFTSMNLEKPIEEVSDDFPIDLWDVYHGQLSQAKVFGYAYPDDKFHYTQSFCHDSEYVAGFYFYARYVERDDYD